MLLSLLLSVSVFLHAKPAPSQAHSRSSPPHRSQRPNALPRTTVVTAVKGDIQFVMIAPHSPEHLMPVKPAFAPDNHAQEEREEQYLIASINAERTQRGLEPLIPDPLLTETARAHSREMDDQEYFDHHSPTVGLATPMDRYLKTLQAWGAGQPVSAIVGENIFYCSVTTEDYNMAYAHQSLMASLGHRANILEPRFTKVGVGLCRDNQGRFWVTEMFLRDE